MKIAFLRCNEKNLLLSILVGLVLTGMMSFMVICDSVETEFKVLVFSKTEGYRHASIQNGIAALSQMAIDKGFSLTTTEDAAQFTLENLSKYEAVIFLSTIGDILNQDLSLGNLLRP